MIKIDHLVKHYGANCAVDDVSFEIARGEVVGLLGPNGAGKSTTMNILAGYLSSSAGRVMVDGLNVLDDPLEVKRRIGYLPEQPPLYLDMTVEEYLIFVYNLKGCKFNRTKHLEEICEVVKIQDVFHRVIRNLSKGYKQRVGIAQALVGNPPVIIFDEPTVGLDPKQIIEIRNLVKMLGKEHTIILSTHILPEVQQVCSRVVVINEGQIVADESIETLTEALEGTRRYIAKICGPEQDVLKLLRSIHAIRGADVIGKQDGNSISYLIESDENVDARVPLFNALAVKGYALIGLEGVDMSLEDVFVRLVSAKEKRQGRRR